MDLQYFPVEGGNFGDDLNQWLWDDLLPGWREWKRDSLLVGVGTVLKKGFLPADRHKLVIGSGVGYGSKPDIADAPEMWDIRAVRGPLSAKALNLPASAGIIDPAVFVNRIDRFADLAPSGETLFVPHHSNRMLNWQRVCEDRGIGFQTPAADATEVIRRIGSARLVLAESMHAAIIADAFGVRWHCVTFVGGFNSFKWNDWCASLGVELEIHAPFAALRRLQDRLSPATSTSAVAGVGGSTAPHRAGRGPDSKGLKGRVMAGVAGAALSRLARKNGALSSRQKLQEQQDEFARVLEGITRDFSG